MKLSRSLPFAALLFAFALAGHAAVTVSDTIPVQKTTWYRSFTIPQFDTSLGTLEAVKVELSGTVQGNAKAENRNLSPATVTLNLGALISVTGGPIPTGTLSVTPSNSVTRLLGGWDGLRDWGGTSGMFVPLTGTKAVSTVVTDAAALQQYQGSGTVAFPVVAQAACSFSGPGNVSTSFETYATATLTVTYYISPAPGLGIDKAASPRTARVGTPITYTYTVKNTGLVPLTEINVVDDTGIPNNPNPVTIGTIPSLDPGASWVFTKSMVPPSTPPAVVRAETPITQVLGDAGPSNFATLQLGGTNGLFNCNLCTIKGDPANIGVVGPATYKASKPSTLPGTLIYGTGTSYAGQKIPAGGAVKDDALLNQAYLDAINAWTYFKSLTPTQTIPSLTNQDNGRVFTGVVGMNVLHITGDINISSGTKITFDGPVGTEWVILVDGSILTNPGFLLLGPNLTTNDVIYVLTDTTGKEQFKTNGNNAGYGIVLAPYVNITVNLGPWYGELVGSYNKTMLLYSGISFSNPLEVTNTATVTAIAYDDFGNPITETASATATVSLLP